MQFLDWELGRIEGYPNVFSAGNVVTGKGNIVASRKHASHVAEHVIEKFLGLGEDGHEGEEEISAGAAEAARAVAEGVAAAIARHPPVEAPALAAILARVRERQKAVGYEGDYRTWLASVTPPDLE
jgi:hypothetical protein